MTDEDSAYVALDTRTYLSLAESMSAPEFTLTTDGDSQLLCRLFCAAEHAEDFHYSFQLLDDAGNVYAGVAEYQGGMVSGSVSLLNRTPRDTVLRWDAHQHMDVVWAQLHLYYFHALLLA